MTWQHWTPGRHPSVGWKDSMQGSGRWHSVCCLGIVSSTIGGSPVRQHPIPTSLPAHGAGGQEFPGMLRNTWLLTAVSQTSGLALRPDVLVSFRHELQSQNKINLVGREEERKEGKKGGKEGGRKFLRTPTACWSASLTGHISICQAL